MDPTQWLTRGHVARLLRVHVSKVRRLEARGELVPVIEEEGGLRYFTLHQVMALQRRQSHPARDRAGEVRLAAFELFNQGVAWQDVAMELRHDPLRTYRLWRLFMLDRQTRPGAEPNASK